MRKFLNYIQAAAASGILFSVTAGAAVLVCISVWAWFFSGYARQHSLLENVLLAVAGLIMIFALSLSFILRQQVSTKEAELNRQKERYRNLFEMVPCEIAVLDRKFRLVHFNRRFGVKFNPKPGDYCFQACKGRSRKCEPCPVEQTLDDGLPHFSEESGYTREGEIAHWLVVTAPQRDESGEITGAMEMTVDLTNLRLLEDKLKKSEKKYRDIFNNIANPIFVVDRRDLTILDCNNSALSVYGYNKSELCSQSFLDLFVGDERSHYANAVKTQQEIHRARHIGKNGKTLFVNIRISPSEYEGKNVYLVTTSDITKRLEAEQQLIQASKMATLGEMATGVAHELNQPLSVIKTASSYLMKKIKKQSEIDSETLYTMTSEIDSHINRATRIINHMREFGRKSEMDIETVNVNPVIEKAFEIFAQQLKLRGIEVVWDLAPDLPGVRADTSKLEQVIINLLVNARDAMEAHWGQGSGDGSDNGKKIFIRTYTDGSHVTIEVEDTGKGIPDDLVDKIFEPFFTTKEAGKGTGLGLSISYSIVREWGAEIYAEPYRSRGARFVIRFPVDRNAGRYIEANRRSEV
ncbi:MAG: PAS domain-containing sensor histidine kinase [Desulfosalsimonas sp.]